MILTLQLLGVLIVLAALYLMVRPIMNGAVYLPVAYDRAKKIVEFAEIKPGDKVVDLGSGDGRRVVAFAKMGAEAYGFEINPWLVYKSNRLIRKEGLEKRAKVYWQSFWKADLSHFNVIYVFGIGSMMQGLEKKFHRELKPGAKVIAYIFRFPTLTPSAAKEKMYVYEFPQGA